MIKLLSSELLRRSQLATHLECIGAWIWFLKVILILSWLVIKTLPTGEFMAIFFARGERLLNVNCGNGEWIETWVQ